MRQFHKIIRLKRKEMRMTQQEFAEKLNVTDKTISKWETGKYYPDITLISSIAKILNVSVDELMGSEDLAKEKIYNNEAKIDEEKVYDFKKKVVISISLFSSILLLFILKIIKILFIIGGSDGISKIKIVPDAYEIISIILIILISVSILCSISLFIIAVIKYRNFYMGKFYKSKYQLVFNRYSLLYIQVTIFLLTLIFSFTFNNNYNAFCVFLIWLISALLVVSVTVFLNKISDCKFRKDIKTLFLVIIGVILSVTGWILLFISIFPYVLISLIGYVVLLVCYQRNTYTKIKI